MQDNRTSAVSYMDRPQGDPPTPFQQSGLSQLVQNRRPRVYSIELRSIDRVAGTPTNAVFDLGNLKDPWDLLKTNLDAGARHYELEVESFGLEASNATPGIVEVRASSGWPTMPYTYTSRTQGSGNTLCVGMGAVNASYQGKVRQTLTALPMGRVGVQLVACDPALQAGMEADATLAWHLLLDLKPTDY